MDIRILRHTERDMIPLEDVRSIRTTDGFYKVEKFVDKNAILEVFREGEFRGKAEISTEELIQMFHDRNCRSVQLNKRTQFFSDLENPQSE